jgi:toxin YoeB
MIYYDVKITDQAKDDLSKLKHSLVIAYEKTKRMVGELRTHPRTGTGKPAYKKSRGYWARRITDKHRLAYEIHDDKMEVAVLSAWGHYDDK